MSNEINPNGGSQSIEKWTNLQNSEPLPESKEGEEPSVVSQVKNAEPAQTASSVKIGEQRQSESPAPSILQSMVTSVRQQVEGNRYFNIFKDYAYQFFTAPSIPSNHEVTDESQTHYILGEKVTNVVDFLISPEAPVRELAKKGLPQNIFGDKNFGALIRRIDLVKKFDGSQIQRGEESLYHAMLPIKENKGRVVNDLISFLEDVSKFAEYDNVKTELGENRFLHFFTIEKVQLPSKTIGKIVDFMHEVEMAKGIGNTKDEKLKEKIKNQDIKIKNEVKSHIKKNIYKNIETIIFESLNNKDVKGRGFFNFLKDQFKKVLTTLLQKILMGTTKFINPIHIENTTFEDMGKLAETMDQFLEHIEAGSLISPETLQENSDIIVLHLVDRFLETVINLPKKGEDEPMQFDRLADLIREKIEKNPNRERSVEPFDHTWRKAKQQGALKLINLQGTSSHFDLAKPALETVLDGWVDWFNPKNS